MAASDNGKRKNFLLKTNNLLDIMLFVTPYPLQVFKILNARFQQVGTVGD